MSGFHIWLQPRFISESPSRLAALCTHQASSQDPRCGDSSQHPQSAFIDDKQEEILREGEKGEPGGCLLFPSEACWAEKGQFWEQREASFPCNCSCNALTRSHPTHRNWWSQRGTEAAKIPGGPGPAWGPGVQKVAACVAGTGQFGVCVVWFNSQRKMPLIRRQECRPV